MQKSVIVTVDSGRNFVDFNSTITTACSSEHVTNVSFLVVTNL